MSSLKNLKFQKFNDGTCVYNEWCDNAIATTIVTNILNPNHETYVQLLEIVKFFDITRFCQKYFRFEGTGSIKQLTEVKILHIW